MSNLKTAIKELVQKRGPNWVKARLVERGIGVYTVAPLVDGTYKHEPNGATRTIILEVLENEGISVAAESAS